MRRLFLLGMLVMLCGCGGGGGASSNAGAAGQPPSMPSPVVNATATPPATTLANSSVGRAATLHEAQFAADSSLRADLGINVVVDHLETATPSASSPSTASRDTASRGVDRIPFRVATDTTFHFSLNAPNVAAARLVDMQQKPLATLAPGARDVGLKAGDYQLELTSANRQDALVFIAPGAVSAAARSVTPGVYITELPPSQMMAGAATSITAFVGYSPNGPTSATLVTNMSDYSAAFGTASTPLLLAVSQFFANGGNVAMVVRLPLTGGATSPAASDVVTGLRALDSTFYNLLVLSDLSSMPPDQADPAMLAALSHATSHHAMLLLDLPATITTVQAAVAWSESHPQLASSYAAAYWPNLQLYNPSGASQTVGPAASMAGLYAQTDNQVGVWKAPAGLTLPLVNVVGLTYLPSDSDDTLLLPARINPIRSIVGNIVPWGARTMTRLPAVPYVAERRLLEYIENSVAQGLQWVVFEPGTPALFASVDLELSSFLNTLWAAGGLFGSTPGQAFIVTCDPTNNPPETLALGSLFVRIMVAVNQPAEFDVINLETPVAAP